MMPPLNWEEGFFKVIHEWFVENPFDNACFTKLITICWQIWKARNGVIFKGKHPDAWNVVDSTPPQWVKINFDGSVRSGATAGGFIIRTNFGNPILAAAFNCGRANVSVTEAMALRNSLIQARELGVTIMQLEGDSGLVIDVINGIVAPPLEIAEDFLRYHCLEMLFSLD
ncbi:hypothetical protein ACLB2K_042543 [Fragaria x ananassa]